MQNGSTKAMDFRHSCKISNEQLYCILEIARISPVYFGLKEILNLNAKKWQVSISLPFRYRIKDHFKLLLNEVMKFIR